MYFRLSVVVVLHFRTNLYGQYIYLDFYLHCIFVLLSHFLILNCNFKHFVTAVRIKYVLHVTSPVSHLTQTFMYSTHSTLCCCVTPCSKLHFITSTHSAFHNIHISVLLSAATRTVLSFWFHGSINICSCPCRGSRFNATSSRPAGNCTTEHHLGEQVCSTYPDKGQMDA